VNLSRLPHEPGALVDFYQQALEHLGAVCERTWFDRLQLVAEGRVARLWNDDGALHETELHFPAPEDSAPRDAAREVFPGCPLTFRLAETFFPSPLTLERAVLSSDRTQPPTVDVAEKLWRAQWPDAARWRMDGAFKSAHHFSLLALARCEIQAIDQHWSLRRVAVALPGGETDESLAAAVDFADLSAEIPPDLNWPACDTARLHNHLSAALTGALTNELNSIRQRQENYLRRELDRIDDYFAGYARELSQRAARTHSGNTKLKAEDRLAAAQAEHARRRADQVQRHEIRVLPRLDALLLLAEPAWQTTVTVSHHGETRSHPAHFVPRNRRWFLD
jgi:hypothetical protein